MRFHICNIEPQGYAWGHFLDDFCRLLCFTLESLGHACTMACNQIEPGRVNIVLGGHALNSPAQVETIASACSYVAVQHEVLNPGGVNLTQDAKHLEGVYLPFLRRALAVWEGIARNLPVLEKLGLRTAFFRGGYHPALSDVRRKNERDIDFLFYGSMTPHRRRALEQLAARGHRVVAVFDPRAPYRNDLIGRAQVNLAPIQGAGMQHFAYGRVCYLLNNQSLVVVEQCEDQAWLESCFITAPPNEWVSTCEQTLLRPDLNSIRDEFCERFKQLPFANQLQGLLDATFSPSADGRHTAPLSGGPGHEQTVSSVSAQR